MQKLRQGRPLVSILRIHKDGLSGFVKLSRHGRFAIFSSGSTGAILSVPITMPLSMVLECVEEVFTGHQLENVDA
jgi:hypothetical protein